jgi:hypothetical protein
MTYNSGIAASQSLRNEASERAYKRGQDAQDSAATTLCRVCGKPPRTQPTGLLPQGYVIPGAVRCEAKCPTCVAPEPTGETPPPAAPGMSPERAACLAEVAGGAATSNEVGDLLGMTRAQAGRQLRKLAADGHLVRVNCGGVGCYCLPGTTPPTLRVTAEMQRLRAIAFEGGFHPELTIRPRLPVSIAGEYAADGVIADNKRIGAQRRDNMRKSGLKH